MGATKMEDMVVTTATIAITTTTDATEAGTTAGVGAIQATRTEEEAESRGAGRIHRIGTTMGTTEVEMTVTGIEITEKKMVVMGIGGTGVVVGRETANTIADTSRQETIGDRDGVLATIGIAQSSKGGRELLGLIMHGKVEM